MSPRDLVNMKASNSGIFQFYLVENSFLKLMVIYNVYLKSKGMNISQSVWIQPIIL